MAKIDSLVYGGRGIGSHEGMKVFVEDVVPGDTDQASLSRIKNNYAEAKLVESDRKKSAESEPKCKHFGVCGWLQMAVFEL